MSDAITVLGSRHGLFFVPCEKQTYLIRYDKFPGTPCEFKAGITINGRTRILPLCTENSPFDFLDQDSSVTTFKLTGIDAVSATKLELRVTTPFKPRDADFSTMPILDIRLTLSPLDTTFRWKGGPEKILADGEIFLEIRPSTTKECTHTEKEIRFSYEVPTRKHRSNEQDITMHQQTDALVVHAGSIKNNRISVPISPATGPHAQIHASWCTWSSPVLSVREELVPFRYVRNFKTLEEVTGWAHKNPEAIYKSALSVDKVFGSNNSSRSINNLLANTLHSWLVNTWWADRHDGEWFSVWEGSCYYHSTVDVEYTQTPFYLTVWPELLGIELDEWPLYVASGDSIIGEKAKGTIVFLHDMGNMTIADTAQYNHHMPVEENTNYVLMSYAYWCRTGDDSKIKRHAEPIRKALDFILACDTTGNGIPDIGMANTIDDASPAVQYGREQIYLAVKALAAFRVGTEMLLAIGNTPNPQWNQNADSIRDIVGSKGWKRDHFVTLLDKSGKGIKDCWTGKELTCTVVPGWDAAHIYTANGLALLDMVGTTGLIDEKRLKKDLEVATVRCLDKFGCRHSDYTPENSEEVEGEGGKTMQARRIGWISMNMLRDISAAYRGIDLRWIADRYWEFQTLTNTQGPHLFFETFNGNNLMCYPRGIAVFGFFDALAGAVINKADKHLAIKPLDKHIKAPLFLFADWLKGTVPVVENGKISDPSGLIEKAGLKA
jgi:hypothetical protein